MHNPHFFFHIPHPSSALLRQFSPLLPLPSLVHAWTAYTDMHAATGTMGAGMQCQFAEACRRQEWAHLVPEEAC